MRSTKVQRNMGTLDKVLRVGMGSVLIYMGFIDSSWIDSTAIAYLLGLFGFANLVSSVLGICPAYCLADISTRNQRDVSGQA